MPSWGEWKCKKCKSKEKPDGKPTAKYCKKCGCAECFRHKGKILVEGGVKVCQEKRSQTCEAIWITRKNAEKVKS